MKIKSRSCFRNQKNAFTITVFSAEIRTGYLSKKKMYLEQGCTNPGCQIANAAKFCTVNGKAVPLQAWSGPEDSRKLRFPDFVTTAQDGGKAVSLTHRRPLPPGNIPGNHFS